MCLCRVLETDPLLRTGGPYELLGFQGLGPDMERLDYPGKCFLLFAVQGFQQLCFVLPG